MRNAIPNSVAIVAAGESNAAYLRSSIHNGGPEPDQVWAINVMGSIIKHDLLFHMDDIRVQEERAKLKPNLARWLEWMKHHNVPIVTCRAFEDYPATVEYPLEDVLNDIKLPYINSTSAYALLYAIWLRIPAIGLFGMDFSYADQHKAEKGRACVEFWIRYAMDRGLTVFVPDQSPILDSCERAGHWGFANFLYGYDGEDLELDPDGTDRWKLTRTPRNTLPTAEAMEERYWPKGSEE